jgi:hypothetical protein
MDHDSSEQRGRKAIVCQIRSVWSPQATARRGAPDARKFPRALALWRSLRGSFIKRQVEVGDRFFLDPRCDGAARARDGESADGASVPLHRTSLLGTASRNN